MRFSRRGIFVVTLLLVSGFQVDAQNRTYEKLPPEPEMQGIGGVFIYANNPDSLASWYREHLGIESVKHGEVYSYTFFFRDAEHTGVFSSTTWAIFPTGKVALPDERKVMISYRIRHLEELLTKLKAAGITIEKAGEFENVSFVRLTDPEGNPLELSEDFNKYDESKD